MQVRQPQVFAQFEAGGEFHATKCQNSLQPDVLLCMDQRSMISIQARQVQEQC